jgi:hypothetical protein
MDVRIHAHFGGESQSFPRFEARKWAPRTRLAATPTTTVDHELEYLGAAINQPTMQESDTILTCRSPLSGPHPPIVRRDERERCVSKRTKLERENCARTQSLDEAGLRPRSLSQRSRFAIGVAPRPRSLNRCGGGKKVAVGIAPSLRDARERPPV